LPPTVLRLDVAERPLRAVSLVPGALHRQFGGTVRAGVPLDNFVGGGQRHT
jgi:hypothetical protein